jgi:hypothetical protein
MVITQREIRAPAAKARDLAGLCSDAFIHISTVPFVHSQTGVHQRVFQNYPQDCAQGVILAGRGLQVNMSRRRKQ